MASLTAPPSARPQRVHLTMRKDAWWLQSLVTLLGLSTFLVYVNWAIFQGEHYAFGNYLSPFYSPELWGSTHHAWFGPKPAWWPEWLLFSPAMLILWMPAGFRFTCYYYRGAYYKAFWADPPGCAVAEPRKSYLGEQSFPLIIQNIHRYFMYLAVAFLFVLAHDVWKAMWFVDEATGTESFGIGVGTIVLAANTVFLACYTLGCHSFRHMVGGFKDEISKSQLATACYNCSSKLNGFHMNWAWTSLVGVMFADVYVRLCSMGIWSDWRIF